VDDRLRVYDDLDPVEVEPEQEVRLDHLEALVDEGRGVDRDERPHRPGRVGQRLVGSHRGQVSTCPPTERAAAGRDDELAHLVGPTPAQALGQRRVLGIDRHDLPGFGERGDQVAADDQGLFVGQRQGHPGLQRDQRGPEPCGAVDRVEHDVARQPGALLGCVGSADDPRQLEVAVVIAALLRLRIQRELQVLDRRAA
jgi:hypothetical protein